MLSFQQFRESLQEQIDGIHHGEFHKWLGKDEAEPITDADIEKGLSSDDEHVKKMAQFAKNAKSWKH